MNDKRFPFVLEAIVVKLPDDASMTSSSCKLCVVSFVIRVVFRSTCFSCRADTVYCVALGQNGTTNVKITKFPELV